MCGIAGWFTPSRQEHIQPALLDAMTDALAHRGPDGRGVHHEPGVALGHRRLAIIDIAGGAQPMHAADGSAVLVFNGEIYNFRELRRELEASGCSFRSHSDSEVLLQAYGAWGPSCVERLQGMFAFAIWDRRADQLVLARDRLGIKPLYWAQDAQGSLVFGSELKSLLTLPGLARQLDARALENYCAYGYVPEPRTIYAGIHKLAPAHTLIWRKGTTAPQLHRYWDVTFDPGADGPEPAAAELRARLAAIVRQHLIADVPLGAFLSGGVDSSAVVATMARATNTPVHTCTIGFADEAFDERDLARHTAERLGTAHRERVLQPAKADPDALVDLFDEPFADSSALPSAMVARFARETVKVVLSGDGGDEVFAGYRRYPFHLAEEKLRGLLPLALRRPTFGALAAIYPKADRLPRCLRAKSTLQALAVDTLSAYADTLSDTPAWLRHRLYAPAMHRRLDGFCASDVLRAHARRQDRASPLARAQYLDLHTWLPGRMLTKVDRASMAAGLEVRVPFLDHTLVEWAARLPDDQRLGGGTGKRVLKQAFEGMLDAQVLYGRKRGFGAPLDAWFRGPLRTKAEALRGDQALGDSGIFDMTSISQLADAHIAGRRHHGATLWSLCVLAAFLRRQSSTTLLA